jgi:transposase
MIPSGVEIYLALEPIDMRQSFERLSGLTKEHIGYDARSGALFVFFGRRKDALKVLFFDGSGMVIFYKRLDRGRFQHPRCYARRCARRTMSSKLRSAESRSSRRR